jgi:RHS repeat-associated protein
LGRPYKSSLPYYSCNEGAHNTTTTYDAADRAIEVATEDTSGTTYTYAGSTLTVTDAQGNQTVTVSDGLGRIQSVTQGNVSMAAYSYDVLDDLLSVVQGSPTNVAAALTNGNCTSVQCRSFAYNSLKQLVSAQNPENVQVCYGTVSGGTCSAQYDSNGNLLNRTDNRSILTTYSYDALNRLQSKLYSDGTPNVSLGYDNSGSCPNSAAAYNKGRLTSVTTVSGAGYPSTSQTMSYDPLGRTCQGIESVGSQTGSYNLGYQYSLASALSYETYPSGRVVQTQYDGLDRPNNLSSGTTTYVNSTNTSYEADGTFSQLQFGPSSGAVATQYFTYDQGGNLKRRQLTQVQVSAQSTNPLILNYSYCPGGVGSCSTNNGNLQGASIVLPSGATMSQSYLYDGLNRLVMAAEFPLASVTQLTASSACSTLTGFSWCQQYSLDVFGNNVPVSYGLGGLASPSSFDANTNRMTPNNQTTGWHYDLAGDLDRDPSNTSYLYDAEGRVAAVCPNQLTPSQCTAQWQSGEVLYTYDGNGNRVQITHEDASVTVFVYDANGQMAAEYGPSGTAGTDYLVTDALGSTRMVLTGAGCPAGRMDYLPFGFTIPSSIGLRSGYADTCAGGTVSTYGQDPPFRQRFTGKERDSETGLDYFGARYMSSAQGRMTSPDPVFFQAEMLTDPQRFNLYAYGRNNPLRFVDPSGEKIELTGDTEEERERQLDAIRNSVGAQAGAMLVAKQDENGSYYVEIEGDVSAFKKTNAAAAEFASIIGADEVAKFALVNPYETLQITDANGNRNLYGMNADGATGRSASGQLWVYVRDPDYEDRVHPGQVYDTVSRWKMSDWRPGTKDVGIVTGHEFGHAFGFMAEKLMGFPKPKEGPTEWPAIQLENRVRENKDPGGPKRTAH